MWRRKWFVVLLIFLVALLLGLAALPGGVATAAPVSSSTPAEAPLPDGCRPAKIIIGLRNEPQLEAFGLHRDVFGSGKLTFDREERHQYASLGLAPDLSGNPVSARITEVDTSLPPEERIKCWQPTEKGRILAKYTIRFEQAERPPGLTENVFLWNSPFGADQALPLTAVGVSTFRNPQNPQQSIYVATIAQDVVFQPDGTIDGLFFVAPMPVDPTEWHTVRVHLTKQHATISVVQGQQRETVLSVDLPTPLEALAFEASVDNELFPGFYAPVSEPDTIDVAAVAIRHFPNRGKR